MVVTLDATVVPQPHVVAQVMANEAVLLMPARGEVKVLNEVGARMWTLFDGKRTLDQIAALVCTEYAVERAQAEQDVLHFANELAERDLVTVRR